MLHEEGSPKACADTEARGVVVAPQPIAVEVGAAILRDGGNAIDAAIATALAQGVVDPFMGGIGGFGCMCIHSASEGKTVTVGFHGKAGSNAHPDIFAADVLGQIHGHGERYDVRGGINQIGYKSVVVPGTLAGFERAHQLFGKMPWEMLFEHAIKLAKDGIPLPGEVFDRWIQIPEAGHRSGWERINATPACRALFTHNNEMLKPGMLLRQTDYAATLERLAHAGASDFYTGDIASMIMADFDAHGGLFTSADLASYRATVLPAVSTDYRGFEVRSMPLPASGPQLVMMLKMLQHLELQDVYRKDRTLYVHLVARAIQLAFSQRAEHFGDPEFLKGPVDWLLSDEQAERNAETISGSGQIKVTGIDYLESKTTTNVCVIDSERNAVALTHTLGSASGVVTDGLGFVFNNCMYQYNPVPGNPNSIAPGKSRLTGISPTILFKEGVPWAAVGALGGTRIVTAVLHTIINMIDLEMTPVEAVEAPRFHSESKWLELESRLSHSLGEGLTKYGWCLRPSNYGYDPAFAIAHVALCEHDGTMRAGSDPRGGGGISFV